ncbi:flap endonuclease-1 [Candidatus Woesearchaeota archaeon]|nr:flap endonuclease-1 [Candidatus Woesearchaeota archaeon]
MGTKLKDLVDFKEIKIEDLKGKVLAVDAHNILYQFLTTIRQRDGSLLTDSKGRVTSHLNGLFYRTTRLMHQGLKLVFIYDGKPPEIKGKELEKRKKKKIEAKAQFEAAKEKGEEAEMKKYAARTTRLTPEMIDESKKLLKLLGIPVVQAPSEGEAQAGQMVKDGKAWAVVSQDFDNLLFGCPRMIRNLSVESRRKKIGSLGWQVVKPELILLSETLNKLGIDQEQLIVLGILVGTDFNIGGIPGIGPKKALKLVKEVKDFDDIFEQVKWKDYFEVEWKEIFYVIKKMPVQKDYELKWKEVDVAKLRKFLVEDYEFSAERVDNQIKRWLKEEDKKKQKGLGEWV